MVDTRLRLQEMSTVFRYLFLKTTKERDEQEDVKRSSVFTGLSNMKPPTGAS
jgi:hypothetical protein